MTAFSARAETFTFPGAGFTIDMPDGWHAISVAEETRIHSDTDLGSDDLNASIRAPNPGRLAVVVRDKETRGVNPGIHLNFHPGEILDLDGAIQNVLDNLGQVSEFQLIDPPVPAQLGPFETRKMRYRFAVVFGVVKLRAQEVFWLVPMGDHYLTISTGADVNEGPESWAVIEAAAQSLRPVE
ncbi:MAG: hypothetical protein AAGI13_13005 [Pseudomonadota bacterium]